MNAPADDPKGAARELFASLLRDGWQPAALHAYTDESGAPLFSRARFRKADGSKTLRPFHHNGAGWVAGEPKYPRGGKPLYALHRLATLRSRDPLAVVVEGESCADALNRWAARQDAAVVAVTSGASDSAQIASWAPLKGLRCLVWPDHDEPGTKYADAVERALAGNARDIERLDAGALGIPEHGDCVEWLESHPDATADTLATLPRATARTSDDWPAPVPLPDSLPPVESWDWDLLPAELVPFVRDITLRLSVAPELVAAPLLCSLGGVIGRSRQLDARPGWRIVPNLWGMTVANPAGLKSPAKDAAAFMLDELESDAASGYELNRRDLEAEAAIREAKAKVARKALGKLATSNPAAAKERALEAVTIETEMPPQRRFVVQSFTVEKLGELLRENSRGLTLSLDELVGLFRQLERTGHEQDRTFLLVAQGGESPLSWDTIGRGTVRVQAACLAIIGTTQPAKLAEMVRDAEGPNADGLLQRFGMIVFPDPLPYAPSKQPADTDAQEAVRRIFKRLAAPHAVDTGGEPDLFRFAPDAQEVFDVWDVELRNRAMTDDIPPELAQHLGKLSKTVGALALLFHLIRPEAGAVVGLADLERALVWSLFLESHAARAYVPARLRKMDAARLLLRHMKAARLPRTFAARDVYRNGWSGLATPEQAGDALDVLADFNWVRSAPVLTTGRPGRVWTLHPSLSAATSDEGAVA